MKMIRERIRINGQPIAEELFTRSFFEVWDKLPTHATSLLDIPRYLQLLTLTSYRVFMAENVDVAIYETHLGGEFDATNVLKSPRVTAVTAIEMDHVNLLGPTIEKIAWHKGGIFKPGSLALSTFQLPAVAAVLHERAAERKAMLEFVGIDEALPATDAILKPSTQRQNCSLALAICRAWLRMVPEAAGVLTSDDVANGVRHFQWPGRFQKISEGHIEWYLDGAHTHSSMEHAVRWFAEASLGNER